MSILFLYFMIFIAWGEQLLFKNVSMEIIPIIFICDKMETLTLMC